MKSFMTKLLSLNLLLLVLIGLIGSVGSIQIHNNNQIMGIFDRAVKKLTEKSDQQNLLQSEQAVKHAQNLEKAQRQAMLIASPYSNSISDIQQVMQTVSLGGDSVYDPKQLTYDEKVKNIANNQTEYVDEYEGFGSLTEMIKNQDKIAKNQVEEKQKQEMIKQAKEKMTKALAKPIEDKEAIKKAQEEEENKKKKQKEEEEKLIKEKESKAKLSNDDGKPKKLTEQEATQLVEEASLEQEAAPSSGPTEIKEDDIPEQQGFISKYTEKIEKKDENDNPPQVQVQEEKQPETKGMLQRFEEKLKTDEEDGKKATEVVQAFQHALNYNNRSIMERASEKFMQDIEDDQSES